MRSRLTREDHTHDGHFHGESNQKGEAGAERYAQEMNNEREKERPSLKRVSTGQEKFHIFPFRLPSLLSFLFFPFDIGYGACVRMRDDSLVDFTAPNSRPHVISSRRDSESCNHFGGAERETFPFPFILFLLSASLCLGRVSCSAFSSRFAVLLHFLRPPVISHLIKRAQTNKKTNKQKRSLSTAGSMSLFFSFSPLSLSSAPPLLSLPGHFPVFRSISLRLIDGKIHTSALSLPPQWLNLPPFQLGPRSSLPRIIHCLLPTTQDAFRKAKTCSPSPVLGFFRSHHPHSLHHHHHLTLRILQHAPVSNTATATASRSRGGTTMWLVLPQYDTDRLQ
jgi:hypothetical protein